MHGLVPNVSIGQTFPSRQTLHDAGVHRGLMRGISPGGESIVRLGWVRLAQAHSHPGKAITSPTVSCALLQSVQPHS